MGDAVTIEGELRVPAGVLEGQTMERVERHLQAAGLLPVAAQRLRWRMDPDAPGGYVLTYVARLRPLPQEDTTP